MTLVNRAVGIAFDAQGTEGTALPGIVALNSPLTLADGIILGDVGTGIAKSGITHSFTRRLRENGTVSNSFTELSSDFLEEEISLSFAFPMAGPRTLTGGTPADADFTQEKGIDALLGACGLAGALDGAGVGWKYTPADVVIATAKIFDSGIAWIIRDIRGDWSLTQTPGEIGIMTCALTGTVDSFDAAEPFPTMDYEEQASINAPSVQNTASTWSFLRGWTEMNISCANSIETIPDSNSSTGNTFDQTARVITATMNIRDDSSDLDFTRTELIRDTAPTNDLTYAVGAAAAATSPAVSYKVSLNNLESPTMRPMSRVVRQRLTSQ
jgi:hypothetical protein